MQRCPQTEKPQLLLPLEASFPCQTVLAAHECLSLRHFPMRFFFSTSSLIFFSFFEITMANLKIFVAVVAACLLPAFLWRFIFKDALLLMPFLLCTAIGRVHGGEWTWEVGRLIRGSTVPLLPGEEDISVSSLVCCVGVLCAWPCQWMGWRSREDCAQFAPGLQLISGA